MVSHVWFLLSTEPQGSVYTDCHIISDYHLSCYYIISLKILYNTSQSLYNTHVQMLVLQYSLIQLALHYLYPFHFVIMPYRFFDAITANAATTQPLSFVLNYRFARSSLQLFFCMTLLHDISLQHLCAHTK